jgi:hypothetical protein
MRVLGVCRLEGMNHLAYHVPMRGELLVDVLHDVPNTR